MTDSEIKNLPDGEVLRLVYTGQMNQLKETHELKTKVAVLTTEFKNMPTSIALAVTKHKEDCANEKRLISSTRIAKLKEQHKGKIIGAVITLATALAAYLGYLIQ